MTGASNVNYWLRQRKIEPTKDLVDAILARGQEDRSHPHRRRDPARRRAAAPRRAEAPAPSSHAADEAPRPADRRERARVHGAPGHRACPPRRRQRPMVATADDREPADRCDRNDAPTAPAPPLRGDPAERALEAARSSPWHRRRSDRARGSSPPRSPIPTGSATLTVSLAERADRVSAPARLRAARLGAGDARRPAAVERSLPAGAIAALLARSEEIAARLGEALRDPQRRHGDGAPRRARAVRVWDRRGTSALLCASMRGALTRLGPGSAGPPRPSPCRRRAARSHPRFRGDAGARLPCCERDAADAPVGGGSGRAGARRQPRGVSRSQPSATPSISSCGGSARSRASLEASARRSPAFDRSRARAALAPGTFDEWLVSPRALIELDERRAGLLSLIDARVAERGEAAVLSL